MDLYNEKQKRKQKSKEPQETGPSASSNLDNFDPGDMVKAMHTFVDKVSGYRGAEVPEHRFVLTSLRFKGIAKDLFLFNIFILPNLIAVMGNLR